MEGDLHTLQEIKGIGDKISEKIIKSVGGEEELQKIIDDVRGGNIAYNINKPYNNSYFSYCRTNIPRIII